MWLKAGNYNCDGINTKRRLYSLQNKKGSAAIQKSKRVFLKTTAGLLLKMQGVSLRRSFWIYCVLSMESPREKKPAWHVLASASESCYTKFNLNTVRAVASLTVLCTFIDSSLATLEMRRFDVVSSSSIAEIVACKPVAIASHASAESNDGPFSALRGAYCCLRVRFTATL